jgi:hypothetical protein
MRPAAKARACRARMRSHPAWQCSCRPCLQAQSEYFTAACLRRRLAQHWVNNIWAKVSTALFYRTEVGAHARLWAPGPRTSPGGAVPCASHACPCGVSRPGAAAAQCSGNMRALAPHGRHEGSAAPGRSSAGSTCRPTTSPPCTLQTTRAFWCGPLAQARAASPRRPRIGTDHAACVRARCACRHGPRASRAASVERQRLRGAGLHALDEDRVKYGLYPRAAHLLRGRQDIFSLFHLDRSFKFISKRSIFLYPIVGWSMFLTGAALS